MTMAEAVVPDIEPSADREIRLAALERALDEERRRADTLNRIAAAIGAGGDLEGVVQAVVDGGVELTGAAFGAFFYNVIDDRRDGYTLYTLSGAPRSAFEKFPMPRNTAVFDPTFTGAGLVRSDDITQDPCYGKSPPYNGMPEGHLPVRSYLAAPVVVARSGEVLGGLFFGHPEPGVFPERLEILLSGLAAQAAVAIENVQLADAARQEVEERRRAEAALADSEQRFRLIADTIPTLCWMAEADGNIVWYNRRWYEYTGTTEEEMLGWGWRAAHDPAVGPEVMRRWTASLQDGAPFEMVFPLRAADGSFRPFLTRVEPNYDPTGRLIGWFGVNVDVGDETSARERLQFALSAGRLGAWELDVEHRAYEASDICKANYGRTPDQPFTYEDLVASIHPEDRQRMLAAIEEAVRTGAEYDIEYRVVYSSGETHWVHARGRAAQTDHAGVRRMAGVSLDVTERKRAEERQRLLLNELNHRVKNTLATVQSIASQTLRTAPDPDVFRNAFEARLMALSKTHNLLTDQNWEGASLRDILIAELTPHAGGPEGRGVRFIVDADRDVRLKPKATVALGMAVHELATNAVKYGALSTPGGRVEVRSKVIGSGPDAELVLEWSESGGPPVEKPKRRGFGGRLLKQGLAGELAGQVQLDYRPAGLLCRMQLPMTALESTE